MTSNWMETPTFTILCQINAILLPLFFRENIFILTFFMCYDFIRSSGISYRFYQFIRYQLPVKSTTSGIRCQFYRSYQFPAIRYQLPAISSPPPPWRHHRFRQLLLSWSQILTHTILLLTRCATVWLFLGWHYSQITQSLLSLFIVQNKSLS